LCIVKPRHYPPVQQNSKLGNWYCGTEHYVSFKAPALLLLTLSACGLLDPAGCSLASCSNGLTVHLSALPNGPYRVEIFLLGPGQQPAHAYDCPSGQCGQDLTFPDLVPDHAWVRVTTSAGVRTTEFPTIAYEVFRPNGPDCPPSCRRATVTLDLPA